MGIHHISLLLGILGTYRELPRLHRNHQPYHKILNGPLGALHLVVYRLGLEQYRFRIQLNNHKPSSSYRLWCHKLLVCDYFRWNNLSNPNLGQFGRLSSCAWSNTSDSDS